MKTFKLLSFEIVTDDKIQHFPLVDGIIINQENSHQSWVLELFISQKYRAVFDELLEQQSLINVRTV
ncbi:MAG: YwpF family protein, partial [Lysinibacillus sp.]